MLGTPGAAGPGRCHTANSVSEARASRQIVTPALYQTANEGATGLPARQLRSVCR